MIRLSPLESNRKVLEFQFSILNNHVTLHSRTPIFRFFRIVWSELSDEHPTKIFPRFYKFSVLSRIAAIPCEPDSGCPNPLNYHRSNRWSDLNSKLQKFMLVGNVYQKTVPENQLEVNMENECECIFLNCTSGKHILFCKKYFRPISAILCSNKRAGKT